MTDMVEGEGVHKRFGAVHAVVPAISNEIRRVRGVG